MGEISLDDNAMSILKLAPCDACPFLATAAVITIATLYYFTTTVGSSSKPNNAKKDQEEPILNQAVLTKSDSDSSLASSSSSASSSSKTTTHHLTTTTTATTNATSPTNAPLKKSSSTKSNKRNITWKELKQHSTKESNPWIVINDQVYDITKFAPRHPGGDLIYQYAGRDATDEFDAFHLPRVKRSRLPAYHIGTIIDAPDQLPITRDYRALKEKLWREGWFEADYMYFVYKDMITFCILLLGVFCIYLGLGGTLGGEREDIPMDLSSKLIRVLCAGSLVGLALQQVAFVAHDAGHRGITHPQPGGGINWLGWFHGAVCFGVSIEMWVDEHSGHHAMTMRPHEDPQFKYLPVFLISSKELDRFHELSKVEQVLSKILVPFQHYTLIPISMIIGRFNLHAISLIYALKAKQYYDVFGLVLYLSWFGTIVSYLPLMERLPFVLVSYIVAGILHIQLTISHLATESFTAEEDEKEQFFAFQCKTTRNIDSTKWDDWFHGGLQFQIEHHLFPQMPRHYLLKVKPLVEELCKKHNVPYHSTGFFQAVGECLSDFRRLSYFIGDLVHPHEIMPE